MASASDTLCIGWLGGWFKQLRGDQIDIILCVNLCVKKFPKLTKTWKIYKNVEIKFHAVSICYCNLRRLGNSKVLSLTPSAQVRILVPQPKNPRGLHRMAQPFSFFMTRCTMRFDTCPRFALFYRVSRLNAPVPNKPTPVLNIEAKRDGSLYPITTNKPSPCNVTD